MRAWRNRLAVWDARLHAVERRLLWYVIAPVGLMGLGALLGMAALWVRGLLAGG